MTRSRTDPRPWVVVVLLTLVATAASLVNGFVFDDVPIVLENRLVRELGNTPVLWRSSYWANGLLYRPLTVQLFALEWAAGGGSPVVFHLVNLLLTSACAVAFWYLARRLFPPAAAMLSAAFFAVHPVHVEVTGNVVGQAELLATLGALVGVERYMAWRAGGPLSRARGWVLALITFAAILSKETGIMVPALICAAELMLIRPSQSRGRFASIADPFYLQAAAALGAILLRISVLGPTPAAGPSVALRSLDPLDRIVGMLAVVPHWLRLLFWPAHLQAEYGPPALEITGTIGPMHVLGAALIAAALVLVSVAWHRSPVIAFGLAWMGISLFPVSNILVPTGVVLAERTLFLPSAGAMLAFGGILSLLFQRLQGAREFWWPGIMIACWTLVAAGAGRSLERQRVWRSQEVFFERIQADAPRTYRAYLVASEYYEHAGRLENAERAARRGLELYSGDPKLFEHLGQVLRRQRRCGEALPILAEGTSRFPDRTVLRARYIECALDQGDTVRARAIANEATELGYLEFEQTVRRLGGRP